jgi:hypothetical protein
MTPLFRVLLVAVLTALAPCAADHTFAVRGSARVVAAVALREAPRVDPSADGSRRCARRPVVLADATRHTAPVAGRSVGAAAFARARASGRPADPSLAPPLRSVRRRLDSHGEYDAPVC